jgi:hypothetical protein
MVPEAVLAKLFERVHCRAWCMLLLFQEVVVMRVTLQAAMRLRNS